MAAAQTVSASPQGASPVPATWSHHDRLVGSIRWRVASIGAGPLVLLVHGTGASSHSFARLGEVLASRYRVIAPDLPGHAETRAIAEFRPTLPNLADALSDLIETYREELGEPVVVGGHSAGAAVMARMAIDGTIRPRVLVGMGAALMPFRGVARTLFPAMARTLARSSIAARLIARRTSRPEVVSRVMASVGSGSVDVEPYRLLARRPDHIAATLKMMASWELEPLVASLHRVTQPFVLVVGSADRATPVSDQRAALARLTRGRLVVVPDAGHLVHEEAPNAVARLLSENATAIEEKAS